MQILALLANFGPQNVPLIQTSDKFLGWFHMVWCLIYQIKPLVLNLATLGFSPLSSGFENLWPSVSWSASYVTNMRSKTEMSFASYFMPEILCLSAYSTILTIKESIVWKTQSLHFPMIVRHIFSIKPIQNWIFPGGQEPVCLPQNVNFYHHDVLNIL